MNHDSINQPWLLFRSTISVRGISTWNLLFSECIDQGEDPYAEGPVATNDEAPELSLRLLRDLPANNYGTPMLRH